MTGNKKIWRAPVAGLASVAMLATLGVSALTANAVSTTDYKLTWVFANGDTDSRTVTNGTIDAGDLIAVNNGHPAPAGQTATGWYTAAGVGNGERVQPGTKISGDVTLYQHASADVQTIKFDNATSDVEGVMEYQGDDDPYASTVAYGDSLAAWQVPNVDKPGDSSVVTGWNSADGSVEASDGLSAAEIASITPVFNGQHQSAITLTPATAAAYEVNFNTIDFANKEWTLKSGATTVDVKQGAAFSDYGSLPVMTKNVDGVDRQVSSWALSTDKSKVFDPSAAVTDDMDLTPASSQAYWTITFNDGGTSIATTTVFEGSTISAPADPTRLSDDYQFEFAGWYTGANKKFDFTTKITAANASQYTNLYAHWNIVAVKVTFVPNYGSEMPTTVWIKDGDKLTAPELTRDGYQLVGWGSDYEAAQGYPLHIHTNSDGNTAYLYFITTGSVSGDTHVDQDGTASVPVPATYTAEWKENAEAIKDYENLVDVDMDADEQKAYTADSYAEYVDAFKGDYLTAKAKAAANKLTDAEYTALLTQLKDLQAKLVEVGGKSLYRVYNPNNGDHYFTTDQNEASALVKLGWKAEGAPYKVVSADSNDWDKTGRLHAFGTEIFSVYNPNTGEHLLTEEGEADALAQVGWIKEDVKFYTVQNGSAPVVRVYNPNTNGPAHLYTNASEANGLAALGWSIDNGGAPVFTLD